MTTLIFLLLGGGMVAAVRGSRRIAIGLFVVSLAASTLWLCLHMTGALKLAF